MEIASLIRAGIEPHLVRDWPLSLFWRQRKKKHTYNRRSAWEKSTVRTNDNGRREQQSYKVLVAANPPLVHMLIVKEDPPCWRSC
jgi:hypothetical protein